MSTGVNEPTGVEGETPPAPAPGTPEYDQAMAAKYIEANTTDEPAAAPNGDPEAEPKPDDAAATATPSLTIEKGGEEEAAPEGEASEEEAEAPAPIPSELFDKATEEFASSGSLTDETVESFVSKGIPRDFIDNYVAGLRALQAQAVTEAQGLVGGEDNWNAMMTWAKGLPEADVEAFNEAVTNPKTSSLAIQGLYSRFTAANGSEAPSAAASAQRGATDGDVYRSTSEMTSDMRDSRYKTDQAFRSGVEQKIARSRKAGTLGPLGTVY